MNHPRLGLKSLTHRRRELRKESTGAETILWKKLRAKRLDLIKFKRQHGIGPYIVDFCAPRQGLAIEIDGDIHALPDQKEKDEIRTREIESLGYRVIRYTNQEVLRNLEGVLEDILHHLKTSPSTSSRVRPPPNPLLCKEGEQKSAPLITKERGREVQTK